MVKIIYSWRNQVNKCIYIQTHIQTHRHTNTLNRQQTLWIIQQMKSREVYNISFMFLFVFLRINKNSIASIYFTAILHLFLLKWHYWLLTHHTDFNMNTIKKFFNVSFTIHDSIKKFSSPKHIQNANKFYLLQNYWTSLSITI